MEFIFNIIKGMVMGIANIIPGVSGGTMAVSMGIYDRLIASVSGIFRNFRKSLSFLAPIFLGLGIGIIGFTYIIGYLLENHTYVTDMAFTGLILGGLPVLIRRLKQELKKSRRRLGLGDGIGFIVLFGISIAMTLANGSENGMTAITPSFINFFILFFIGTIASATMIIPGVSGSLVLMILGYYYGILNSIKTFFHALKEFNLSDMLAECLILVPFGIGVLIGIIVIAKIIEYLFQKHSILTYCSILGLIASSPFAIFYNTGVVAKLPETSVFTLILGMVFLAIGVVITLFLGEKTE